MQRNPDSESEVTIMLVLHAAVHSKLFTVVEHSQLDRKISIRPPQDLGQEGGKVA